MWLAVNVSHMRKCVSDASDNFAVDNGDMVTIVMGELFLLKMITVMMMKVMLLIMLRLSGGNDILKIIILMVLNLLMMVCYNINSE